MLSSWTRIFSAFFLGFALAMVLLPRQAQADGGAPNLAYVAGARQGIGVVDISQQKIVRNFAVAGNPYTLLLSPDGSLLYVTQPAAGQVTALAARTGQVICSAPFPGHPAWLALNIDATVLYVAGMHEQTIIALDARTCAQLRTFQAPEPVSWLAATGNNASNTLQTQLWVAGTTSVSVLDEQGQLLGNVAVAGGARFLCLPGGLTAYVATGRGTVIAIDTLTYQVIATLLTGGTFGSLDYNAITQEIYVPDQQHNLVDVLTPVLAGSAFMPHEPARSLRVSGSPQSIAVTNDGQLGFAALSNGQVDMLDLLGHTLIKAIPVGGTPRFIITGVYPPQNVPVPQPAAPSLPVPLLILVCSAFIGVLFGVFLLVRSKQRRQASPTG